MVHIPQLVVFYMVRILLAVVCVLCEFYLYR